MSANLTIPNVLTPKEAAYRLKEPSLRPVDYTQEIGSAICDRLFNGETLSEICRDAAMPDKPTVMRWLAQYSEFLDECLFTHQLLAEVLAAEAVVMADNADTECRKRVRDAKVITVFGREQFARCRRLCLAVRHWVADRLIRKFVPQSEPY
jgi:hypothetical protein